MKILKWMGGVLAVIVVFVLGFYFKAYWSTEKRLNKKYAFNLSPIEIKSDSAILQEGFRLTITKGCTDCHTKDLGGKIWLDKPMLAQIIAPNLTKGVGGLPQDYSPTDWLRSLKHGLKRDSTPLKIMPSHEFTQLAKDDMMSLIAYCSQLKPIDRELPQSSIGFLGYILTDLEKILLVPAERIDHKKDLAKSVGHEVTIEFGQYLSIGCEGCHRINMKGGAPIAPGFPEVADITSTGNPGKWTEAQFITTLKTGLTPEGKKLKPEEMPWPAFNDYTETELKALYKYLKSL
jgi:mono/diheme cytochrome c family protein